MYELYIECGNLDVAQNAYFTLKKNPDVAKIIDLARNDISFRSPSPGQYGILIIADTFDQIVAIMQQGKILL